MPLSIKNPNTLRWLLCLSLCTAWKTTVTAQPQDVEITADQLSLAYSEGTQAVILTLDLSTLEDVDRSLVEVAGIWSLDGTAIAALDTSESKGDGTYSWVLPAVDTGAYQLEVTSITVDNRGLLDSPLGRRMEVWDEVMWFRSAQIGLAQPQFSAFADPVPGCDCPGLTIDGGAGNDVINGLGCSDTIRGRDGNDQLFGHDGRDEIHGGNGSDIEEGGACTDHLYGGPGNDRLYGDEHNDELHGGDDNDTLNGGSGFDMCYGENGADTCIDCEVCIQ